MVNKSLSNAKTYSIGVREINDSFSKTLPIKLNRSFTSSITMTPTQLAGLNNNESWFIDKWLKYASQRPHPYGCH
jgi:hypothetical protein